MKENRKSQELVEGGATTKSSKEKKTGSKRANNKGSDSIPKKESKQCRNDINVGDIAIELCISLESIIQRAIDTLRIIKDAVCLKNYKNDEHFCFSSLGEKLMTSYVNLCLCKWYLCMNFLDVAKDNVREELISTVSILENLPALPEVIHALDTFNFWLANNLMLDDRLESLLEDSDMNSEIEDQSS